ncbi:vWA domain-containing protein [Thalassotalea agarivorans]|uniref:Ca-activated chloride channel family protein n=1 Tax=Thalassotalea agarivorans TaxID=349064 RepID=A0A1I0ETK8_THASX|nr:VWA domain-containing protein [Thalassotalea agarivorans]SET48171.1 Ca-activated chloride channel family protein [Thalassotalea agarivorans]
MDFSQLLHFHLMRPYWLIAIVLTFLILKAFKKRDDTLDKWRKIMSVEMLDAVTVKGNSNAWFSPQKLSWVMVILLTIILVGPTWKQQPSPFTQDQSALIIALDVSSSMEQSDIMPSRLLQAKQKILKLLALRGDANTALVAYAGSAHVVMPITNDREMIRHFLDVLDESIMPVKGKSPEAVIPIANKLLTPTNVPGTLLVITDGAPDDAAIAYDDYFSEANHQLIVWGIGKENAPEGSVLSPLQVDNLEDMANEGRLVLITPDQSDVDKVNRYIENNLVVLDDGTRPWHDSGYPVVFIAAALWLLWFRKGWTLQW